MSYDEAINLVLKVARGRMTQLRELAEHTEDPTSAEDADKIDQAVFVIENAE